MILSALIGKYEIAAVVTQPDTKAGRGQKVALSPVKALAEKHGLTVLQPPRIIPEVVEQVRTLAPAAIVVAAYGRILPKGLLALPQRGCINVHASLLPRYRGAAPIPAAILSGDAQTGVTIMLMEETLDTGPILSQSALHIEPEDTTGSLTEKLANLGAQLLVDTLPDWLAGRSTARPQDESQATMAKMIQREDGRIRWTEPAEMIARRCRAYSPWPGAFALWNKMELKIWRAHAQDTVVENFEPGKVIESGGEIAVITGKGLLVLDKVQLPGKRVLPMNDFRQGQRSFLGSLLD